MDHGHHRTERKNICILWTTAACIVNYSAQGNRKSLCAAENTNCTAVVPQTSHTFVCLVGMCVCVCVSSSLNVKRVEPWPACHLGGTDSFPVKSMWDLRWTKWHWDRNFWVYWCNSSVWFHQHFIPTYTHRRFTIQTNDSAIYKTLRTL